MILEDPQDEAFTPKNIDEQIEHLTQEDNGNTSDFRLVRDLQIIHEDEVAEERAFERIRGRLMMHAIMEQTQDVQAQKKPIKENKTPKLDRELLVGARTKIPYKHAWPRQITLLAAVLLATMIVGSLIVVLQMTHRGIVTTTPHKRLPSTSKTSMGIYVHLSSVDSNSQVVKIDTQTHKVLWRFTAKPDFSNPPSSYQTSDVNIIPVVADGNVYFTEAPDRLYALNAQTGELRWERHFQVELGKPYVVNGVVYINTYSDDGKNAINGLYALNATNGIIKTKHASADGILDIIDDVMYLTNGNTLTAINVVNGRKLWQTKTEALQDFSGEIYTQNGDLYVSSYYVNNNQLSEDHSYVYTINIQNGKIIWRSPVISGIIYHIVINDNGLVYCSTDGYYIYAFDPKMNRQIWKYHATYLFSEMITQGNSIYVKQASRTNFLTALEATTGIPEWVRPLQEGSMYFGPLKIHNSLIYLNTTNGLETYSTSTGNRIIIIPFKTLLGENTNSHIDLTMMIGISIVS